MAWSGTPRICNGVQQHIKNRPAVDQTPAIRYGLSDRYRQFMSPSADYFEYGLQKFTLGSIMDNENISVNQRGCNADWV
jgi:hypothetical protein